MTDPEPIRPSSSRSPSNEDPAGVPHADPALAAEEVEVLLRVGEMLRRLRFGTVLLVVQDGKVVQIEMAEKIRL